MAENCYFPTKNKLIHYVSLLRPFWTTEACNIGKESRSAHLQNTCHNIQRATIVYRWRSRRDIIETVAKFHELRKNKTTSSDSFWFSRAGTQPGENDPEFKKHDQERFKNSSPPERGQRQDRDLPKMTIPGSDRRRWKFVLFLFNWKWQRTYLVTATISYRISPY